LSTKDNTKLMPPEQIRGSTFWTRSLETTHTGLTQAHDRATPENSGGQ